MDDRVDKAFRRAYQAVLDRTPPAPEWDEIGASAPAPRRPPAPPPVRRRFPRGLAALAAAVVVLALIGVAGLLAGDRRADTAGPAPTEAPPPSVPPASAPELTVNTTIPAGEDDPGLSGTPGPGSLEPLAVHLVEASSTLPNFDAPRLIDGDPTTAWNDRSLRGAGAWLEFRFAEPVSPAVMVVHNVGDADSFARNFRMRAISVTTDRGDTRAFVLDNLMEPQTLELAFEDVRIVRLTVESTYAAGEGAGPPFEELAVGEIEFYGAVEGAPLEGSGWTALDVAGTDNAEFRDAAWAGGTFVIVGTRSGRATAWASGDGRAWTAHDIESGLSEANGVVAAPPGFVALGHQLVSLDDLPSSTVIYESADGTTWEHTATIDAVLHSLAAAPDGTVLAAGNSPQLWRRGVDGRWSEAGGPNPGPNGIVYDVAATTTGYLALTQDQGGQTAIYHSDDLTNWLRVGPAGSHASRLGSCAGFCLLSAVEGDTRLLTSADGLSWRAGDLHLPAGAGAAAAVRGHVDPATRLGAIAGEAWTGGGIGRTRAAVWLTTNGVTWEPVEVQDLFPPGSHADAVAAGEGKVVVAGATSPQTPGSALGVWVYEP